MKEPSPAKSASAAGDSTSASLREYIVAREDRWIAQLDQLVREPSLSAEGRRLEETCELVAGQLRAVGAEVWVHHLPGTAPVLIGTLGSGPRSVLFYNHYDVQPPDPLGEWTVPPFEVTRCDGRLLGRGVADDKGDIVSRIAALEALRAVRGELPLRVVFFVEGEEEIGSPNLGQVVTRLKSELGADACVWESGNRSPEGRPILSAGVKGMCYLELTARGAKVDMHSSLATVVPNPAWRLVWALSTLKNERDEILVDGFMDEVSVPDPQSRRLTREVPFDSEAFRATWGFDRFTQERDAPGLMEKLLLEPTCTICGLTSGYQGPGAKTVLPHEARAKVDFRLVPGLSSEKVMRLVRAHLDRRGFGDIEMVEINGEEPYRCNPEDPVVRAALEAARQATGLEPLLYPNMAGTGPMAQVCGQLGLPAVGFGVSHAGARLHAPDENIFVSHFLDAILHVALFLERYAAV